MKHAMTWEAHKFESRIRLIEEQVEQESNARVAAAMNMLDKVADTTKAKVILRVRA